MDRRQRKTRDAIFKAFTELLASYHYHEITVQDIIDAADIGRTTFYAHFETKEYLLKTLCEELFGHIIDTAMGATNGRHHCAYGDADDSVFLHLLRHLQENDLHIIELLSSENNELFLRYFKSNLRQLILTQYAHVQLSVRSGVSAEYVVNHIASSFVETVHWWVSHRMQQSPEEMDAWFSAVIDPILRKADQPSR